MSWYGFVQNKLFGYYYSRNSHEVYVVGSVLHAWWQISNRCVRKHILWLPCSWLFCSERWPGRLNHPHKVHHYHKALWHWLCQNRLLLSSSQRVLKQAIMWVSNTNSLIRTNHTISLFGDFECVLHELQSKPFMNTWSYTWSILSNQLAPVFKETIWMYRGSRERRGVPPTQSDVISQKLRKFQKINANCCETWQNYWFPEDAWEFIFILQWKVIPLFLITRRPA